MYGEHNRIEFKKIEYTVTYVRFIPLILYFQFKLENLKELVQKFSRPLEIYEVLDLNIFRVY